MELSATTATPPAGMRGPASRAAIIQGLLAAPAGRANPPAVLAGFGAAFRRSEPGAGMTGMCERSSSRICAVTDPGSEDEKIITLARSARARVAAAEGAAVRDETGRTYAAAAVNLPSLRLSALRLAVAMAISSGAAVLEAAALVSDADAPDPRDLAVVREAGPGAVVFHVGTNGTIRATLTP